LVPRLKWKIFTRALGHPEGPRFHQRAEGSPVHTPPPGLSRALDETKTPESPCILALPSSPSQNSYAACNQTGENSVEKMRCLRCNCELEPGGKSVALYMFAQTVGIRPRQKSSAQRISFCPQCSVSLAMGPPPDGALNMAAWDMMRDLVGSDPALNQAAWETLSGITAMLPATGTDSERTESAGYFEF
jgi:hypothetical protein